MEIQLNRRTRIFLVKSRNFFSRIIVCIYDISSRISENLKKLQNLKPEKPMNKKTIHASWGYFAPRLFYYGIFTPLAFMYDKGGKAHNYFFPKEKDQKVVIFM